jgi:hypothetical protein
MSKERMIEKAKNMSLVVLFLSTVLLLYFFWGNISFNNFSSPSEQKKIEDTHISEIIRPDRLIINFGGGNYSVISWGKDDLWNGESSKDSMVKEIDRLAKTDSVLVEEIPYDKYQEVMATRSIRADFNYDIPISDFCTTFGIKKQQSFDNIETVTSISYSTSIKKHLFIYDGKNKKYYRMIADTDNTDFESLIAGVEAKGYNSYNPVNVYLGTNVKNTTLIPITVATKLRKFPYKQDIYPYQTEKVNDMTEEFFGGNSDFVRTIIEDKGTVIKMYGYGQTVLIINTDGSVEFKQELTQNKSGQSFADALSTAVDFIDRHGSWKSMSPYLETAKISSDKSGGYQFTFGVEINGTRLFYEKEAPVMVNVTQGQVTYYRRNMIDFDQKDVDSIEANAAEDAFSSVNLIAQNYNYIYNVLLKEGAAAPSADQAGIFDDVASLIKDMQVGYLKRSVKIDNEIQPVWVVTIDNIDVYFDLYHAEPIGYSKR